MKIGWLVWDNEFSTQPEFYVDGTEPEYFHKRIRIIYCEVVA